MRFHIARTRTRLFALIAAGVLVAAFGGCLLVFDDPFAWLGILHRATVRPVADRIALGRFVLSQRYHSQIASSEARFVATCPSQDTAWKRVDSDSRAWTEEVMPSNASPYSPEVGSLRSCSSASGLPDLLRHEYRLDGLHLQVTESAAFVQIKALDAPDILRARSQRALRLHVEWVAHRILNLSGDPQSIYGAHAYRLVFRYNPPLDVGSWFSTDASLKVEYTAPPLQSQAWVDRVDGGVDPDGVFFLIYKMTKKERMAGYFNDEKWFEGTEFVPPPELLTPGGRN